MLWEKSPKVGRNVENISEEVWVCVWVCSQQNTVYCVPERKKGEEDSNVNQISAPHANSNN